MGINYSFQNRSWARGAAGGGDELRMHSTYLPASFSPHLHSQGPDDSEEMSTERACASLISFDSLFHKLKKNSEIKDLWKWKTDKLSQDGGRGHATDKVKIVATQFAKGWGCQC